MHGDVRGDTITGAMYARAVDEASVRLRELRHEEWEDLALAGLAVVFAVAATQVRPALALPLFLGGVALGALGVRALWRRWELLDRLAGERDAYVISEVLHYAAREATIERRQAMAAVIRSHLEQPEPAFEETVAAASDQLEALARELDDVELALDPACAFGCAQLLSDVADSPLLDPACPRDELRSRVCQIRSGFS
jgi:hypothetical protein